MSKKPLGALLLHGFSGLPIGLGNLSSHVEDLGLPFKAPTLRGHGAESPNALKGVGWPDWIADARDAMIEVLEESEKVTIIGHSMGGLIALNLAADHEDKIDSIVVAGGSPKMVSPLGPGGPLNFLAPLLVRLKKKWDMTPIFADTEYARYDTGYEWVPTVSFLPLFELLKETHRRMPEVNVPTLILHSKNDTANSPEGAEMLYDRISTPKELKRIVWFEKTEHVMFLDCEEKAINNTVVEFLEERIKQYQKKCAHPPH